MVSKRLPEACSGELIPRGGRDQTVTLQIREMATYWEPWPRRLVHALSLAEDLFRRRR
jgi:hypothetical protein